LPGSEARKWVLVTGANGLLGTAIRKRLAGEFDLVSIDCKTTDPVQSAEHTFRVDLGDPPSIEVCWDNLPHSKATLAGVIHCAAYYDFTNEPNEKYARLESGLQKLLELFSRDAASEAVFIYPSSMAALSPTEPGKPLYAHSPKAGLWEYPRSKVRVEAVLDGYSGPQAVVQLVLAGIYTDQCELVPLFHWIELNAHSPLRTFYPANADRGLTYVHVEDAAEAFALALRIEARGHHRYLVGEPEAVPYAVIRGETLRAFTRWPLPLVWVPRFLAYWGAWVLCAFGKAFGKPPFLQPWMIRFAGEHFEFDLSETERGLGWRPTRSMARVLPKMLGAKKTAPRQWYERNRSRPWAKNECGNLESELPAVVVVAAVLTRGPDVLIARRLKGSLKGFWEFPGGKVERGETEQEALRREVREELSIECEVGNYLGESIHLSARGKVLLRFYRASPLGEPLAGVAHDQVTWAPIRALSTYRLAPADGPIVRLLEGESDAS
jgi:dihydroflavonol-4-reductase